MKHTITCLVKSQPGVLAKVTGAFADRGVSIYSLAVSETEETDFSRMTVVVETKEGEIGAVEGIADEMAEVLAIQDLSANDLTSLELILLKVRADAENIPKIMQTTELFRAEVVALTQTSMTLSLAASGRRIDGIIRALRPMGILELARSGMIAVSNAEEPGEKSGSSR